MASAFANMSDREATAGFAAPMPLQTPSPSVSLWWCGLALSPNAATSVVDWLSNEERVRMRRFGNDLLRSRYLAGRASLRWVLAQTLGISPFDVAIVRGRRGRPQLAGDRAIDFNVSHTGEVALIGISREGRIGVDVERADRMIHAPRLTRRILTDRERAALPADDDAARQRILRLWTCKEALAKATGDAMSAPFRRLDIATEPRLMLVDGPAPYDRRDFALHEANVPAEHLGTVALWHPRNG